MISSYVNQTIGYVEPFNSNLSLTFQTGSGQFVEDAVGNIIESVSTVIVHASVSIKKDFKPLYEDAQMGQNIIYLKGRKIGNWGNLDINYQTTAIAVLTDLMGDAVTGQWQFIPVVQNRINGYLEGRNKYIEGRLTIAGKV
ncbi:MAG: hypothetical protein ACK55Q_12440 [Dolichospermum sp.]|jgi:hypothetical protein